MSFLIAACGANTRILHRKYERGAIMKKTKAFKQVRLHKDKKINDFVYSMIFKKARGEK